jgi:hypothetical protein
MKMKKIIFLILLVGIISCKNEAERKYEENIEALATDSSFIANTKPSKQLSITKRNEKLIAVTKSIKGIVNADVSDSILTIQVTSVDSDEAQKIATGILNEVKKYKENNHIRTVTIWDSNNKLKGYAGE